MQCRLYVRAMPGLATTTCLTVREFDEKIAMLIKPGVSITVENHRRNAGCEKTAQYFEISDRKVRSRWSEDQSIEHFDSRERAVVYIRSICFSTLL